MNNQECKVKPQIVNLNSKEPVLFPFSIKTSKCGDSCNNINDPHAKLCVPDVAKNQKQVFVTINKGGMKINAGVNAKN